VAKATEILGLLDPRTEVVGIDEAQFFDEELVTVCGHMADLGKRVIVAGLDMDFRGEPFGPMPKLLAVAEEVEKVHAICTRCGAPASYTQRLTHAQEQVVVGAADIYEARCRRCFEPGGPEVQPELYPPDEQG
jgi:thymidine kinase